jgi:hypothetical protein
VGEGLKAVHDALTPIVTTTEIILKLAKAIADILIKVAADVIDLEAAAVKAAIEAVRAAVNALVQDVGFYVLGVTIREITDPGAVFDAYKFLANPDVTPAQALAALQNNQTIPGQLNNGVLNGQAPFTTEAQLPLMGGGGNAGFLKTISESLDDEADPNRPMFDDAAYVGGMALVFGANTYYDIIEAVKKLMKLFGSKSIDIDDHRMPITKGLTAKLTAPPMEHADKLYAVKLQWDALPVSWPLYMYGAVSYDIKEVRVYRSTTPITRKTPVSSLTEIGHFDYDGVTNYYYDVDFPQDPGALYYAVGLVLTDVVRNRTIAPLEVKTTKFIVPRDLSTSLGSGVPPDWAACNLQTMIPQLKRIVDSLNETLDNWEAGVDGAKKHLQEYLDFLTGEIDRYAKWAQDVMDTITMILDALAAPNAYVGYLFFEGRGGNSFLIETLGEALEDKTDNARPPFDTGTEAVGGLVFYAGSNAPGQVQKAIASLQLLFSAEAAAGNALASAAASIDNAIADTQAEITFNDAMLVGAAEEAAAVTTGFNDAMEPSVEDALCSSTEG